MRKALQFVEEYRRKGYPDERIRIIAGMRPEPLRSEVLKILNKESPQAEAVATNATDASESTTIITSPVTARATEDTPEATSAPTPEEAPTVEAPTVEATPAPEPVAEDTADPAASGEEATVEQAPVEAASPRPKYERAHAKSAASEALMEALRGESAALRLERDQIAEQLQRAKADLEKLRAENAQVKELRHRLAKAEALGKELEEVRTQRQAAAQGKAELEARVADLEAALANKESLVRQSQVRVDELKAELAEQQAGHTRDSAQLADLQGALDQQNERLQALSDLDRQLAEANGVLTSIRTEASALRTRERENVKRIGQLEQNLQSAQEETESLRDLTRANEDALKGLQEKLDARESELETLRDHFEREARDLQKRAEQEMWLIQRKLARFRRIAAVVGASAALLLVALLVTAFARSTDAGISQEQFALMQKRNADLESQVAALQEAAATTPRVARETAVERTPARDIAPVISMEIRNTNPPAERAPVQPQRTAPTPPVPAYKEYTIVAGDSLWRISQKVYGDGGKFRRIMEANNLSESQRLQPGKKLRIPLDDKR